MVVGGGARARILGRMRAGIFPQSRRPIRIQSWVLRRSEMLIASQMPNAVSRIVNAAAATFIVIRCR